MSAIQWYIIYIFRYISILGAVGPSGLSCLQRIMLLNRNGYQYMIPPFLPVLMIINLLIKVDLQYNTVQNQLYRNKFVCGHKEETSILFSRFINRLRNNETTFIWSAHHPFCVSASSLNSFIIWLPSPWNICTNCRCN